jgi:hypothetical protein
MAFLSGLLVGLVLPQCVQYVREHPDTIRGGFDAIKRVFGR